MEIIVWNAGKNERILFNKVVIQPQAGEPEYQLLVMHPYTKPAAVVTTVVTAAEAAATTHNRILFCPINLYAEGEIRYFGNILCNSICNNSANIGYGYKRLYQFCLWSEGTNIHRQ
jgi:hypothetical protein